MRRLLQLLEDDRDHRDRKERALWPSFYPYDSQYYFREIIVLQIFHTLSLSARHNFWSGELRGFYHGDRKMTFLSLGHITKGQSGKRTAQAQ
ncbi:Hypothetical predicted protein [Podarcis lilfordi]|uniref:Uncharacterized protein n=1 Tax=Podarcis lilfordi TaxID=74358 RepID=A0AA35LKW4_9SAUR|nr:Hypothetical predicted protein [Podarcis lilfordi]